MEQYQVGQFLKECRKRKNISQEVLCGNFCAVSTLSRIERGEQIPNRKTLQLFFERLGITMPVMDIPMSKTDFERYNLETKIMNAVAAKNYEIKDYLDIYLNLKPEPNLLETQFYEFHLAVYEMRKKLKTNEEVLAHLVKAISLTIPDFSLQSNLENLLFTKIELYLLTNIALVEYFLGREEDAIKRMKFLREYFNKHDVSEQEKFSSYSLFVFWLSNWVGKAGNLEEALFYAEEGIQVCSQSGNLNLFPFFVFNKGYSLAKMGKLEEGKSFIRKAFEIMLLLGKTEDVKYGMEDVKKEFGYIFEENL